jgi:uncharacterized membrane protein
LCTATSAVSSGSPTRGLAFRLREGGAGVAGDQALNLRADGWFHVGTLGLLLVGLYLLYRCWARADVLRSGRVLVGGMVAGVGLFNLLDGLVNHHLLGLHHVHPSGSLAWDVGFLLASAALCAAGLALGLTARVAHDARGAGSTLPEAEGETPRRAA